MSQLFLGQDKGKEITSNIPSNGEITIDYEFDLNDVAPGDYYATVMWYKDWGNKEGWGWYYSAKTENRTLIKISEKQCEKLIVIASPVGGEVEKGAKVTLTTKDTDGTVVSGADIYYTLNGTTPTKSSTKYTSAGITINEACTLKAIAYKDGYETSDVLTATYAVKETSDNGIKEISAGEEHSLILKKDGTLWACGSNSSMELGDGSTTDRHSPIKVMDDVSSMSARMGLSLMVKDDWTLWAIGSPFDLMGLGIDNIVEAFLNKRPLFIIGDVTSVSCGGFHSMILKKDGTLWAEGINFEGQIGNGTTEFANLVQVMSNVASMSAGGSHSLIIDNNGTLWACGYNGWGQLGTGTKIWNYTSPVEVMNEVAYVSAGGNHSLLLKKDGTLWACGNNEYGQLGDGTTTDRHTPVLIFDGTNWVSSTAIEQVTMHQNDTSPSVYSLSGQRLAAPRKGLNIVGGKKVLIK